MIPRRSIVLSIVACFFIACDSSDPVLPPPDEAYVHARPAWSADGQTIAFTDVRTSALGIWVVDTSGNNLRRVHQGDALGVTWSPDGQFIAYQQGNQIFRTSVTVDNPELLIAVAPSVRPSWSPDGSRIAYVRNGIRVWTIATGNDLQLTTSGTSPSWRPGGSVILAWSRVVDGGTDAFRYSIFLTSPDSVYNHEVASFLSFEDAGFFTMTPDGLWIVYSRRGGSDRAQIRRISTLTNLDLQLTTDGGEDPALSPDGEWIVYTRTYSQDGGLWKMRIDGTEKRRLTAP
jgi:Tol biopolymer transport system component